MLIRFTQKKIKMRRNETAHNEKQNGTGEYEANGQELKYIAEAMRWVRVLV